MLSDETATSNQWWQIIVWLQKFIAENERSLKILNKNDKEKNFFWDMIGNITDLPVVVFSKKGYAFENISKLNPDINLTVFTDSNKTATNCMFRANTKIYKTKKFSSKKIDHIYNSIKSKSELIFKDTEKVILIYITYPRKNSRANTISILSKEDFN